MRQRLAVNPIACTGHGICAEMLPELIGLDEWGYPMLAEHDVPRHLAGLARRAVRLCPALALRLEPSNAERKQPTGGEGRLAAGGARRR
jgi:ferredoxin